LLFIFKWRFSFPSKYFAKVLENADDKTDFSQTRFSETKQKLSSRQKHLHAKLSSRQNHLQAQLNQTNESFYISAGLILININLICYKLH
jgi:hypothetical protein